MAEDYYKLLGVSKNATKDEIKSAFRKMAKKHHPDKNIGNKDAEEKFKKINEAYAVLSNDEKRKQYDRFGAEDFSKRYSQDYIFRGVDLNEIFKEFGLGDNLGKEFFTNLFGAAAGKHRGRQSAYGFDTPFGGPGGFNPGGFTGGFMNDQTQNQGTQNKTAETELRISLEDSIFGAKKRVSILMGSDVENFDVTIPKGIDDGKKLRVKGKGSLDPLTQQKGDLFIKIIIEPHPVFTRKGNDLIMEEKVKLTDLVLGGKVRITTIDNQQIELKIPPASKNNAMLRIKGKGIPGIQDQPAGNLLVKLVVQLPSSLDENQKQLFEELAKTGL